MHTECLNTGDMSVETAGEILDDCPEAGAVRRLSLVTVKALRKAEAIDVLYLDGPRTTAAVCVPRCKSWIRVVHRMIA